MYTATTNLVASGLGADGDQESTRGTSKFFCSALQLSGFVGVALGGILFGFAAPLLRSIIGNNNIDAEVFSAALTYVRIRALGMPAAAVIGTSQAACVGMRDLKSPLYVLLAAAVINGLGDFCLVRNANPFLGGCAGAAWATVFSQYAAVSLFVRWLRHRPKDRPPPQYRLQKMIAGHLNRRSTRGFLRGHFRARDFLAPPDPENASAFAPYVIPVTSTQFGRISSYVAMSHVIASSLGTTNMAAHQVIISIWFCLYPAAESLSQAAQSFVPAIFEAEPSPIRTAALRQTLMNFWKAGLVMSAGLCGAVSIIPFLGGFFTADPLVISLVRTVVPLLLVIFSTLGLFTSSEGVLLGQKDLGFLGKSYAIFFFVVPYFMLRLKREVLSGTSRVNLRSVWAVFTGYQLFRTSLWMVRGIVLQRRTHAQLLDNEKKS